MESHLVCNHKSEETKSDNYEVSIIRNKISRHQLIITITKFEKKHSDSLNVVLNEGTKVFLPDVRRKNIEVQLPYNEAYCPGKYRNIAYTVL